MGDWQLLETPTDEVPASRRIDSGVGLTGGGDLTSDRMLSVNFGTAAGTVMEGDTTTISVGQAQEITDNTTDTPR